MTISKRDKKFLYTGAAAISIMAIYTMISAFMASHNALKDDIANKQAILEQYNTISADITAQGDKLNLYERKYQALRDKLLSGNKASVAAAELQKLLQNLTTRIGIPIDSIRVSATKEFEHFVQIPVEISIKCRMRKLSDFMYKIENNVKFLTITKLITKVLDMKKPLDIGARVEVSGFIKREG